MNRLQYQIQTGEYIACLSTSANNSTNWTDLTSASFVDSSTGSVLAADLAFGDITVYNPGLADAFIKLRARTIAGDPTTNELRVLAGGALSFSALGLRAGSTDTISYKKGAAGDDLFFTCSFFRSAV
jgi:hypothetical protein